VVLAVVSVFLASLAALAAADVFVVEAAVDVEDVLVAAGADAVVVVAAAIAVKLDNTDFSPCESFAGALFFNVRHKGQIGLHTMIMAVNELE
jgi:hypothetical protein